MLSVRRCALTTLVRIFEDGAYANLALKEAADKISSVAENAGAELKDFAQAGIKSLLAGWEEVKKTFNEERK